MSMTHVMVDIETLGTSCDAPILTIGAIVFDPVTGVVGATFYEKIDVRCYGELSNLFSVSYETLVWWMEQNEAARKEAFIGENRRHLRNVLTTFHEWLTVNSDNVRADTERKSLYMWSHGKDFDLIILSYALSVFGITVPWRFWETRDTRTIYDMAGVKLRKEPNALEHELHHALGDCSRQIEGVVQAYKILKRK